MGCKKGWHVAPNERARFSRLLGNNGAVTGRLQTSSSPGCGLPPCDVGSITTTMRHVPQPGETTPPYNPSPLQTPPTQTTPSLPNCGTEIKTPLVLLHDRVQQWNSAYKNSTRPPTCPPTRTPLVLVHEWNSTYKNSTRPPTCPPTRTPLVLVHVVSRTLVLVHIRYFPPRPSRRQVLPLRAGPSFADHQPIAVPVHKYPCACRF